MVKLSEGAAVLDRLLQAVLREVRHHADPANQVPLDIAPARDYTERLTFTGLGFVMLGVGGLGAFTPVMPTWPFVLIALFSFARSSRRVRHLMINSMVIRTIYSLAHSRDERPFVLTRRLLRWLSGAPDADRRSAEAP